jgi:hypothetical protein
VAHGSVAIASGAVARRCNGSLVHHEIPNVVEGLFAFDGLVVLPFVVAAEPCRRFVLTRGRVVDWPGAMWRFALTHLASQCRKPARVAGRTIWWAQLAPIAV